MKKIFLACTLAAGLMIGAASCGSNNGSAKSDNAVNDSIGTLFGQAMGSEICNQYAQYLATMPDSLKNKINKDDFMRGVEAAMALDTANQGYMMGFSIGYNALNMATRMNASDNQMNIAAFLKAFKETFMNDSIAPDQVAQYQQSYQTLMQRLQEAQMKKAQEAKAKSPEAIANKNAGEAFVKKEKAADPSIQTSKSGLSYKIVNAGNGDKVKPTDKVKIKYVGKLVDGTEFDKNDQGIELQASNFVPGFSEGLQLLAKGGKGVFYIPGELAYGADGIPQAGIGPMSTLVFEVEVLDVTPAGAPAPAPAE